LDIRAGTAPAAGVLQTPASLFGLRMWWEGVPVLPRSSPGSQPGALLLS